MISASANRLERRRLMGRGALRRRAEEHRVDAAAGLRHGPVHGVVDRDQARGVEKAARDAGLVGGDDDAVAVLRQPRDRLQAAFERPPFGGRLDVLVAVVVDGAVAIQDDELHLASFERSAMRFMVPCKVPRKPIRLARTRGSLSITITLSKKASTGAFRDANCFSAAV